MIRRALLAAAPALLAVPAAVATIAPAAAAPGDRERHHYRRRRGRHRTGLLLKDVTGDASFGRRRGEFEGDALIQELQFRRKLTASGLLDGEADVEGRRRDFEITVENESFRRVGVDLTSRRGRVSLSLGEIELGRRLEISLDAVRLKPIIGPFGDRLEKLFEELAEALEDEGGYRKLQRGRGSDDIEELVDDINKILSRTLHVVDPDRYRG
jgi:hypothetical protein